MSMDGLTLDIGAPIPGSRIGEDPKYDDRYVALKDEIAKLDALTAKSVDFALVERLSITVLTSLAKDLLACTYLAYARYRQHGVRGLTDGFGVLHTFLGAFGKECFPARPRARANAITWLVEAVVRDLGDRALDANDHAASRDAREMCARASAATRAVLGDDAPSFGALEQVLERIVLTAGDAPATPPVSAPVAEASEPTTAAGAAPEPEPVITAPLPTASEPPLVVAPVSEPSPIVEKAEKKAVTLAEVAAAFLEPVPGASPAGAEAKFDPSHEAVCAELAKLSAVTGAVPDYARVIALAEPLLKEKSKDLLIASYLGVALFERDGVRGLPLAIALPAALLERFDAELHPMGPRLRRRANALSFLYDRLAQRLPDVALTRADADVLDDVITLAKQHARVVLMAFESDGPATRTLTEAVDRLALSLPEPEPEPVVAPSTPTAPVATAPSPEPTLSAPATPAPPAVAPAPQTVSLEMPSVPVADVAELGPFLADVGRSLVTAANALRGVDAADPRGVRLLRTGLYLHIEAAPPHGADGKTSVPPPPDALFERLAKMAEHAKWAAILDETEASLGQFRFSLDLHRYSALALRGLGREDARAALIDSLRPFLARVPKLVELSFANGRPFADADTARFLKKELSGGKPSRGEDGAEAEGASEAMTRFEEAASQGVLEDLLTHGEAMIAEAKGGHARFRARLRVAAALADSGHGKAARALHEALDHEVRVHGLELWDPELVLAHLVAFASVLTSVGAADALERLTSRVAALSPRALSTCLR